MRVRWGDSCIAKAWVRLVEIRIGEVEPHVDLPPTTGLVQPEDDRQLQHGGEGGEA
jgi:hypothetical protein